MQPFVLKQRAINQTAYNTLIQQGCLPLFARLYAAREINDLSEIHPPLSALLSPLTLKNGTQFGDLLANAIIAQDKLCIVADYDCDGATACSVAILGLRLLGAKYVDFLVPNRFKNGYGLTPEVVEQVEKHPRLGKPDWIITVDNGISSVEGVDYANHVGIKVLITDHHLSGTKFDDGSLPKAEAILNPNQPNCDFKSKAIAGVGVLFYGLLLARASLREKGVFTKENQPKLENLLDLVAIGTIADVVRLDKNNRSLVYAGLQRIRQGASTRTLREGISSLFGVADKDARIATTQDIGFSIGPRINAAGRLKDMSIGIHCLISDNEAEAANLAYNLHTINLERRELEGEMQGEAEYQVEKGIELLNLNNTAGNNISNLPACLVLYEPSWHQGVVGLVASKIKDKYWRPTIAFALADMKDAECNVLRGSGRSITGLHIRDALDMVSKRYPTLIKKFGGHSMAAGLSIDLNDLDLFKHAIAVVCDELLSQEHLKRTILTDSDPDLSSLTVNDILALESAVWGQGFEAPVFESVGCVVEQRVLKDAHLKLKIEMKGIILEAIWFRQNQPLSVKMGVTMIKFAYRLNINTYKSISTIQAIIEYAEILI